MKAEQSTSRRDFLKLAGTAAPAAVVAVAAGPETAAAANDPNLALSRMQDTEHTRKYYELARF